MKHRIVLALALCAGCGTEPLSEVEYAATPVITLDPDKLNVNQADWLEIALLSPPRVKPDFVHLSWLEENDEPWIARCDRVDGGFPDCDDFERRGLVIVGQEAFDALTTQFGGCAPSGNANIPGDSLKFNLRAQSCFGLIRYKILYDEEKVEFIEAPWSTTEGRHSLHITGCGETWAAYQLYKRAAEGEVIDYPADAMFSDTVWMTVTGC
ncbi:MAG: hypothetical protein OXE96_16375 [Gemmatimonadetes bacterium]|nr:hypothetical protein [Gemmatimonadota bacterium]